MATKKRNKKYNPNKSTQFYEQKIAQIKDVIKPEEHTNGLLTQQKQLLIDVISNNKITIDILLNEIQLIYQWTFMCNRMTPDVDTSEIIQWIEKQYAKLEHIQTVDELNAIRNDKIIMHYTKKDLFLAFIEHMYEQICSIKSRTEYAILFKDALVMNNLRIGLIAKHMRRFFNQDATQEALKDCRERIQLSKKYNLIKKEMI